MDKETNRGLIICIEGLDRSGKSTQCKKIIENLNNLKINNQCIENKNTNLTFNCKLFRFPDSSKPSGKLLREMLTNGNTNQKNNQNETINENNNILNKAHATHLMFSANRWECVGDIEKHIFINSEKSLSETSCSLPVALLDRYFLSGIAYSAAQGLPYQWSSASDSGLPLPDLTIYLSIDPIKAAGRADYGNDKYESIPLQTKVSDNYNNLIKSTIPSENLLIIDATLPVDEITNKIINKIIQISSNAIKFPTNPLSIYNPLKLDVHSYNN